MSYTYTAPRVILDILAGLRAALPAVDVLDGPVVSGASLAEAITVGFQDGEAGLAAVEAELERATFDRDPTREMYTLNCSVAVIAATSATSEARDRAFALLAAVNDVVSSDATFTASVLSVRVARYSLRQDTAPKGIVVRLFFGLDVDAFTKEDTP